MKGFGHMNFKAKNQQKPYKITTENYKRAATRKKIELLEEKIYKSDEIDRFLDHPEKVLFISPSSSI